MPKDVGLKSEGLASSFMMRIRDSRLRPIARRRGSLTAKLALLFRLKYLLPIALEFQGRFAPELENRLVESFNVPRKSSEVVLKMERWC
jgi:hypothetical protein